MARSDFPIYTSPFI